MLIRRPIWLHTHATKENLHGKMCKIKANKKPHQKWRFNE